MDKRAGRVYSNAPNMANMRTMRYQSVRVNRAAWLGRLSRFASEQTAARIERKLADKELHSPDKRNCHEHQ